MLTKDQHTRISRKCYATLLRAIESLPEYLREADCDKAASIVADLMKAFMASSVAEEDPGAALAEVIARCREETDAEQPPTTHDFSPPAAPIEAEAAPNLTTFEPSNAPTRYEAQILSSPSRTRWDD